MHPVSYNAVRRWIKKIEKPIATEKKRKNLIAIDETVVKANKKSYFVYSAVDIERNELILIKDEELSNYFVKEVLKYCENKPKFVIDKVPWLIEALKSLNLEFEHEWEKKIS